MDFVSAVKTCLTKYVRFSGRAVRSEFWYWTLFVWVLSIIAIGIDRYVLGGGTDLATTGPISTLIQLAVLFPTVAVGARRLHDIGRSGWWQLLSLTGIGVIVLLYWYVKPGDVGPNKFAVPTANA